MSTILVSFGVGIVAFFLGLYKGYQDGLKEGYEKAGWHLHQVKQRPRFEGREGRG